MNDEHKKTYIFGDFNFDLFNIDRNNNVRNFINMMQGNNLFSMINRATRVTGASATLIDNIFTNDYMNCKRNGIIYQNISDHFPIFSFFNYTDTEEMNNNNINNSFTKIKFRNFSNENINLFKMKLEEVDWSLILSSNDVNVAFDNFNLIFINMFEKYFPEFEKHVKNKFKDKPWVTAEIKMKIKERNKLQKKYAKWPLTYNEDFKRLRNQVTNEIKMSKQRYFRDKFSRCSGDAKDTWKVINRVMCNDIKEKPNINLDYDDRIISDSYELSNIFNDHFSSIGPRLANEIPEGEYSPESFFGPYVNNVFTPDVVSAQEIIELVGDLGDVSAGFDLIPAHLIKKTIHNIIIPFTHICNQSLQTGIFPDKLKESKVIPLHKGGSKSDLHNYRPISLLSVFSKIIEKLMYNRLDVFLETNKIITEKQYGFRSKKSTTSAILSLTDYILRAFDNGECIVAVFLDLSKAFDTVDHSILLKKLNHIGVRGVALDWFKSYLNQRKQFTKYKDKHSRYQTSTYSVPQGSNLGPLLFIIYINDLVYSLKKLNVTLFADDTCLYLSGNNLNLLIHNVNIELKEVKNWLNSNKLTLNLVKSHYMVFHRNKNLVNNLNEAKIIIDSHNLQKLEQTKFLGLILQSNLKWDTHIKNISNKLNKYSGILYKIRDNLDRKSLKLFYNGLVYPQLTYANIIWGNTFTSHLKPLVIAQKRIIRTMMYRHRIHHTNNDFLELSFLKLPEINIYFGLVFVFKSLNSLVFPINYFTHQNNPHYNLRNTSDLTLPLLPTLQGQKSPSFYCAKLWNDIPAYIKSMPSVSSFKSSLKSYLINKYTQT